jgi:hypothetical protein
MVIHQTNAFSAGYILEQFHEQWNGNVCRQDLTGETGLEEPDISKTYVNN